MARSLGCGPMAAVMIFLFVVLFGGLNEGVGFYYTHCNRESSDFFSCLIDELADEEEEEQAEEGTVTATGTYPYKDYSVTVTMHIPLQGGAVTGTVSGTCDGKVSGTYNGQPNGAISGNLTGVCAPFFVNIPAGASFSGTVNKTGKSVPIGFSGSAAGFSHQGSMALTFP